MLHDVTQSMSAPVTPICAGIGCIAGGTMKIHDAFRVI